MALAASMVPFLARSLVKRLQQGFLALSQSNATFHEVTSRAAIGRCEGFIGVDKDELFGMNRRCRQAMCHVAADRVKEVIYVPCAVISLSSCPIALQYVSRSRSVYTSICNV